MVSDISGGNVSAPVRGASGINRRSSLPRCCIAFDGTGHHPDQSFHHFYASSIGQDNHCEYKNEVIEFFWTPVLSMADIIGPLGTTLGEPTEYS